MFIRLTERASAACQIKLRGDTIIKKICEQRRTLALCLYLCLYRVIFSHENYISYLCIGTYKTTEQ